MLTIPTIPADAVVGLLLQVFAIVSTGFVVVQISLLLVKKVIREWHETRDELRSLRPSGGDDNQPINREKDRGS